MVVIPARDRLLLIIFSEALIELGKDRQFGRMLDERVCYTCFVAETYMMK